MAFKRLPLIRKLYQEHTKPIAHAVLAKFAKYPIPQGLIVLYNDTSVPDGWERFTSADDKLIVGAGDTYGNGDTGGSTTVTGSITTGTDGSHTSHPSDQSWSYSDHGMIQGSTDGNHSHSVDSMTYTSNNQKALLIKALTNKAMLPVKTAILSTQAHDGLSSVFTNDYYFESASSVSALAGSFDCTVSSSGSHNHGWQNSAISSGGSRMRAAMNLGSHTHTSSISASPNIKAAILRALSNASNDFNVGNNMIALWESATPPIGWVNCDGTNGTPNLQDRFIKINSTGDGTLEGTGNTVSVSGSIDSSTWGHVHYDTPTGCSGLGTNRTNYAGYKTASHGHTLAASDKAWTPAYYGLYFIMYNAG